MKILVTGSGGQLGSEIQDLVSEFPELQFDFTDYPELDITNASLVSDLFKQNKYDYCINCAAYTAVDKAETEREASDKINLTGSLNLAKACKPYDVTLIHISTDFVFNGGASVPLKESHLTDPVNYYGVSKLKGERAIQNTLKKHFYLQDFMALLRPR